MWTSAKNLVLLTQPYLILIQMLACDWLKRLVFASRREILKLRNINNNNNNNNINNCLLQKNYDSIILAGVQIKRDEVSVWQYFAKNIKLSGSLVDESPNFL